MAANQRSKSYYKHAKMLWITKVWLRGFSKFNIRWGEYQQGLAVTQSCNILWSSCSNRVFHLILRLLLNTSCAVCIGAHTTGNIGYLHFVRTLKYHIRPLTYTWAVRKTNKRNPKNHICICTWNVSNKLSQNGPYFKGEPFHNNTLGFLAWLAAA